MSQVIKLTAANTVCNNSKDIADELRVLAKRIESGDYGSVRVTCTVIDTVNDGVWRYTAGPAGVNKLEAICLLMYGIHHAHNDD